MDKTNQFFITWILSHIAKLYDMHLNCFSSDWSWKNKSMFYRTTHLPLSKLTFRCLMMNHWTARPMRWWNKSWTQSMISLCILTAEGQYTYICWIYIAWRTAMTFVFIYFVYTMPLQGLIPVDGPQHWKEQTCRIYLCIPRYGLGAEDLLTEQPPLEPDSQPLDDDRGTDKALNGSTRFQAQNWAIIFSITSLTLWHFDIMGFVLWTWMFWGSYSEPNTHQVRPQSMLLNPCLWAPTTLKHRFWHPKI